ncbi:MAG: rRNA maturation RNase YbeY [Thermodesulfovibrionales bacterium]|nr:rRNA maturation RNase YbeY [Thermodesulfovibrionales bacterium]
MEIVIRNNQRLIRINRQKIERALTAAIKHIALTGNKQERLKPSSVEVSVLLVNDKKMRELNRQYRGIDRTTDVLSFPQHEFRRCIATPQLLNSITHLGDIVISLPQAKRQAEEHGLFFYGEISWLLIHGLLHLLGYDHEKSKYQARKMRKMERELLNKII